VAESVGSSFVSICAGLVDFVGLPDGVTNFAQYWSQLFPGRLQPVSLLGCVSLPQPHHEGYDTSYAQGREPAGRIGWVRGIDLRNESC